MRTFIALSIAWVTEWLVHLTGTAYDAGIGFFIILSLALIVCMLQDLKELSK